MTAQKTRKELGQGMLTDADIAACLLAYLRDKDQADEEAIRHWLSWAEETRVRETLLRLVLKGKVTVRWVDDDLVFHLTTQEEGS